MNKKNFEAWLQEEHNDIYEIYMSYIMKYNEYKKEEANKDKERTPRKHRKVSEEDIASAISLYKDENASVKEIAETLGITKQTLYKCFRERGIGRSSKPKKEKLPFRVQYPDSYKKAIEAKKLVNKDSLKEAKSHYQRWDQYQLKKLEILYKSGMDRKTIAHTMGRSISSIDNVIEKEGLAKK